MASVSSIPTNVTVTMDLNTNKVALEDCICPICMCILIEPVTMPCQHELCMPCFKQNVEETSLTCPMCRTRISVWARQAARNHCLINQTRWQQIQFLFPSKVQRRLEGKDDDSSEEVFSIPKPQLAEPGEIRKEYEEQLKKIHEERLKEREASERLIRELQEEEERKLQEKRQNLKNLETHDRELAQELSQVINEAGTDVPINLLMQESESRLTRSSSSNSNIDKHREPSTLESFLERMKEKAQNKPVADPYPFQCLTPSEKEDKTSKRTSTSTSGPLTEKSTVRPETLTVSSSSGRSLQDMFSPVSSVVAVSEGRGSDCTIIAEHARLSVPVRTSCAIKNDPCDKKQPIPAGSKTCQNERTCTLLEEVLQAPDLNPEHTHCSEFISKAGGPKYMYHGSSSSDKYSLSMSSQRRCPSAESNDSISPEISHFKPIQSCPRTPPRKVGGKPIDIPVIQLTPINLHQSRLKTSAGHSLELNKCNETSAAMQRRLRVLAEDRRRQVEANSKSTSTQSAGEGTVSCVKQTLFSSSESSIYSPSASPFALHMKPKAPCTISSETQLDVNSNESPNRSSVNHQFQEDTNHDIASWLNSVPIEKNTTCSPYIASLGKMAKPVLPLVSCVDDFDELDGSPPLPKVNFQVKVSTCDPHNIKCSNNTYTSPSPIILNSPSESRNLFNSDIDGNCGLISIKSDNRKTPVSLEKQHVKRVKKGQNKNIKKSKSSPQMSLTDMFRKAQETKHVEKQIGMSPCFASACSTPVTDERSVQMKSLIDQALHSLERDDTNGDSVVLNPCFSGEYEDRATPSKDHQKSCDVDVNHNSHNKDLVPKSLDFDKTISAKGKGVGSKNSKSKPVQTNVFKPVKTNVFKLKTNTLDKFLQKLKSNVNNNLERSPGSKRRRQKQDDPDYEAEISEISSRLSSDSAHSESDTDFEDACKRKLQGRNKATKKSTKGSNKTNQRIRKSEILDPSYEPPCKVHVKPEKMVRRGRRQRPDSASLESLRKCDAEVFDPTYEPQYDLTPERKATRPQRNTSVSNGGARKRDSELLDPTYEPQYDLTPERKATRPQRNASVSNGGARKRDSELLDPTYEPQYDLTPERKATRPQRNASVSNGGARKHDSELLDPTYEPPCDVTPEKKATRPQRNASVSNGSARKRDSELFDPTYEPPCDVTPEKKATRPQRNASVSNGSARKRDSELLDPTYEPPCDVTPEKKATRPQRNASVSNGSARKRNSELFDRTYEALCDTLNVTPEKKVTRPRRNAFVCNWSMTLENSYAHKRNLNTETLERKHEPDLAVIEGTPEKKPSRLSRNLTTTTSANKVVDLLENQSVHQKHVVDESPSRRLSCRKRRKPAYLSDVSDEDDPKLRYHYDKSRTNSNTEESPNKWLLGRRKHKPTSISNNTDDKDQNLHVLPAPPRTEANKINHEPDKFNSLRRQPLPGKSRLSIDTTSNAACVSETESPKENRSKSIFTKKTSASKTAEEVFPERSCSRTQQNIPVRKSKLSCQKDGTQRKSNSLSRNVDVSQSAIRRSQKTDCSHNPNSKNKTRTRLTSLKTNGQNSTMVNIDGCQTNFTKTGHKQGQYVESTQEELDRQLALQLQRQFELEERMSKSVDRSKGSVDEYAFRRRKFSPVAKRTRHYESGL